MELKIGSTKVYYIPSSSEYVTSYLGAYSMQMKDCIASVYNIINRYYLRGKIYSGNVCAFNTAYISEKLDKRCMNVGRIIITKWLDTNATELAQIEKAYGDIGFTIGASFHELVYLHMECGLHIAVETTIHEPYKMQFCVGSSYEELQVLIKIRYQCRGYVLTDDLKSSWLNIIYG